MTPCAFKFAPLRPNSLKALRLYEIDIASLKEKTHRYEYDINDAFFSLFEGSLVERGNCKVTIELKKTLGMLALNFTVTGSVELICDRTLEPFQEPIEVREAVFYKFGQEEKELSDNVMVIPLGTTAINVAHHIYDFICLAVPAKKLHPKVRATPQDQEDQEVFLVYSTGLAEEFPQQEQEEDFPTEIQWQMLKEKFNNANKFNTNKINHHGKP